MSSQPPAGFTVVVVAKKMKTTKFSHASLFPSFVFGPPSAATNRLSVAPQYVSPLRPSSPTRPSCSALLLPRQRLRRRRPTNSSTASVVLWWRGPS
uniref:Uncharacterized protein n=1 Tax=Panagrellus redivivus TaxID=6233 RepID=A0A7E4W6E9_PANRE